MTRIVNFKYVRCAKLNFVMIVATLIGLWNPAKPGPFFTAGEQIAHLEEICPSHWHVFVFEIMCKKKATFLFFFFLEKILFFTRINPPWASIFFVAKNIWNWKTKNCAKKFHASTCAIFNVTVWLSWRPWRCAVERALFWKQSKPWTAQFFQGHRGLYHRPANN